MIKVLKILLVILVIGVVAVLSFGCNRNANQTQTPAPQVTTVQKGNISITVSGSGNLAYSKSEKVAFEMAGYVEEVLVSESESVKKGQELARLDTEEFDKQVKKLESALNSAKRSVTSMTYRVTDAQRVVSTKEFALNQAKMDVETAQYNLNNIQEVKDAQRNADSAQTNLDVAKANLKYSGIIDDGDEHSYWSKQIGRLEDDLAKYQKILRDTLSGRNLSIDTNVVLQIQQNTLKVEQAKKALADAQTAIDDAKIDVEEAKLDQADAEQAMMDAQTSLDEARQQSPIVTAPFDGFITKVSVVGGDEVYKGTVAVEIADPNQFEANIMVTERDILTVKAGGKATVDCDALSGASFAATITQIAPLATVSQGVVNYKVTVTLDSLVPVTRSFAGASTGGMPSMGEGFKFSGTPPAGFTPPANFTLPANFTPPAGMTRPSAGGLQAGTQPAAQEATLKDGLSVNVTIPVQEKNNVIVVPSRAISRKGPVATVEVVKGTGTTAGTETRTVVTGLSDSTNTEIVEGLSEGEQIMVQVSSSGQRFFGPGPFPF